MSYDGEITPKPLTGLEAWQQKFNCPCELFVTMGSTFSLLPYGWADRYEIACGWLWLHIGISDPAWWLKPKSRFPSATDKKCGNSQENLARPFQ